MLSEWECKKRWKCPSDRELALRAKMNCGWSIHTANVFHKTELIPPNELQAIKSVIRRANELERLEVERVGRMLCKLDNMTKNALGDGEKTCSMCGSSFGIFRSTFVHCVDCNRAVCEKCRVDTCTASLDICMLCKICSENREVWKKSGGWFYGKFPVMTEDCQKKCEDQISGSPSPVRAFDTWAHRVKDIVRLQSYEPPEENRNDHSQYKDWTMNSTTEISCLESTELSEKEQNDDSQHKGRTRNSIPDIKYLETSEPLQKKHIDPQHKNQVSNSIPDLRSEEDDNTDLPFIKLESFRNSSPDPKQLDLNYLSVQSTKLSSSCPSLTNFLSTSDEACKLRRKASIRRKKPPTPSQKNIRNN